MRAAVDGSWTTIGGLGLAESTEPGATHPGAASSPTPWLLGSSGCSAQGAGARPAAGRGPDGVQHVGTGEQVAGLSALAQRDRADLLASARPSILEQRAPLCATARGDVVAVDDDRVEHAMKVGIIGAGIAGLSTAKTLRRFGHEVVVLESAPDVGGVWSATRRYPGVSTQSPRDTYAFSDHPMPSHWPQWPSGEQVQEYLASYARRFGLDDVIRLRTVVEAAEPVGQGWRLGVRPTGAAGEGGEVVEVDHLVVANGIFSEPAVPDYPGLEAFAAAGGRLVAAPQLTDAAQAAGAHVVVVGYGKSACDVATAVAGTAASTHVVARQLLWKVPRRIAGVVNFKFLLLTRLGEALFRFQHLRGAERFIHGPADGLRRRMLNSLGSVSVRQHGLAKLGLVPRGAMEDIVRHAIGMTTDGFYEKVADGEITVVRDQVVEELLDVDGQPSVRLGDGRVLPADLVVCATGYRQSLPFFDDDLVARLTDARGNFLLYRQVLPVDVPHLTFAGYNSSFFSQLNAEMAALWQAALLAGHLRLPPVEDVRTQVAERLAFYDEALSGHHSRGSKIIPFSMHNVDELLDDLDLNLPAATRAKQWVDPIRASSYAGVADALAQRMGLGADRAAGPDLPDAPAPVGAGRTPPPPRR